MVVRIGKQSNFHGGSLGYATAWVQSQNETFLIRDKNSCILVEEGRFFGMGSIEAKESVTALETAKSLLTPYPENEIIRSMIRNFVERNPNKVIRIA